MRVPRGVRCCSAGSAPTRSVQPCVCIPRPAEGQRKDPRAHECDESGVKQQQQQKSSSGGSEGQRRDAEAHSRGASSVGSRRERSEQQRSDAGAQNSDAAAAIAAAAGETGLRGSEGMQERTTAMQQQQPRFRPGHPLSAFTCCLLGF